MGHIIRQSIIKEPWSSLIYSPSHQYLSCRLFPFFGTISSPDWRLGVIDWLIISRVVVFLQSYFGRDVLFLWGNFSCFCGFCVLLLGCKSYEIEKGFGAFCILHSTLLPCQSPFSQLAWNWLRLFGNPEDEVPSKPAILDLTAANKDGPTENAAPLTLRFWNWAFF